MGYYLSPDVRLGVGYAFGSVDDADFSGYRADDGIFFGVTFKINELFGDFGQQEPIDDLDNVNLTFTKILKGNFGKHTVKTWKDLVYEAHHLALQYFSVDELIGFSIINVIKGERNDNGFCSYPDLGISIQSADSNKSWRSALNIAQFIDVEIELFIKWQNKDKAAYPGKKGKLFWNG